MAEKTIKHASFWYVTEDGVNKTAVRGDTVDITRDEDLRRGERHGAFATEQDLADGSEFATFMAERSARSSPTPADAVQGGADATPPAGDEGAGSGEQQAATADTGSGEQQAATADTGTRSRRRNGTG